MSLTESGRAALERAVAEEEAARVEAEREAQAEGRTPAPREGVSLRQRAWPMVEMLRRAQAEGKKAEVGGVRPFVLLNPPVKELDALAA